ncbi:pentapeptide repeat-containing protein [Actinomadura sp. 6N118]|uniref:pentapeptide repeat-containing protein n=1 Tax=Actinomadura sp. 6N118 TaxID=3375151 RepID=UPI0037910D79
MVSSTSTYSARNASRGNDGCTPAGLNYANLFNANLILADLTRANLTGTLRGRFSKIEFLVEPDHH